MTKNQHHRNIQGEQPTLLERKKVGARILKKITNFVDTFINGITGQ
jgi:type I restriction enzyme R subunit